MGERNDLHGSRHHRVESSFRSRAVDGSLGVQDFLVLQQDKGQHDAKLEKSSRVALKYGTADGQSLTYHDSNERRTSGTRVPASNLLKGDGEGKEQQVEQRVDE